MKPKVILYDATSLDGQTEGFIPEMGKFYELAAHWQEEATMTGCDTILQGLVMFAEEAVEIAESEALAEMPGDSRPLMVIVDSRGRLHDWKTLKKLPYWRKVIILCSKKTPQHYLDELQQNGFEFHIAGNDRVDLAAALNLLNEKYDVQNVRVESGGTLNGALLEAGLADEISVLIHPTLVGGDSNRSFFRTAQPAAFGSAITLKLVHLEQLPEDLIWLRYEIIK